MWDVLIKWFRKTSNRIVNSIAFFPLIMAIGFLAVGFVGLWFDYSTYGRDIKDSIGWLDLEDASTARSIVSTIAAGIISLSVFSFSLVMIVLNQTASSMSNRILETLIGNRFQQIVLGFYIGTIVYSFFLLSTIKDRDEYSIPGLSIYLLIFLTIIDIFLFVYFLHYITQSVKYDNLIRRIYKVTRAGLEKHCTLTDSNDHEVQTQLEQDRKWITYLSEKSGYLQGSREENLIEIARSHQCCIRLLHPFGSYVLAGTPLWATDTSVPLPDKIVKKVELQLDVFSGQSIEKNPFYGFQHLAEVAIKALSPSVNDPGTATFCVHALDDLLAFMTKNYMKQVWKDDKDQIHLVLPSPTFNDLFRNSILPIWDYGQNDRMLREVLIRLLEQFLWLYPTPSQSAVLHELRDLIASHVRQMSRNDPDRDKQLSRLEKLV